MDYDSFHVSVELWGGVICLISSAVVYIHRRYDKIAAHHLILVMLCAAVLMGFDAMPVLIDGKGDYVVLYSRIAYFAMRFFSLLIMPLVARYISRIIYVRTDGDRIYWDIVEWIIFCVGVVALGINEVYPYIYEIASDGSYVPLQLSLIPGVLVLTGLIMTLSVAIVYLKVLHKMEKISMIVFLALPIISIIFRSFFRMTSYTELAVVVSVLTMFISYEASYSDYMLRREKQLHDEKLRIINRQMQPHFIFNSLGLIRYQCQHDPEQAVSTINDFSAVIRRTTDFMGENNCITIRQELDLVDHYLNIQRRRFDDSIDIKMDISDEDFDVPPFSVQTLIENALHYGLNDGQSEDPRIEVSTEFKDGEHIVRISDNGVGFDTSVLTKERHGHVGIRNTEERLDIMCGGRLTVESEIGRGTTVTMIIPGK